MRLPIHALSRLALLAAAPALSLGQAPAPLRPPAVPQVTHNPNFSGWSAADRLTDAAPTHRTGKPNRLTALIRIDGVTFQVMGRERTPSAVLEQQRLSVLPTRTIYNFAGKGVRLDLTFFTPALPHDLDILSRPATYIEWTVSSTDGNPHRLQLYFDAAADLVVNTPDQPVWWGRSLLDGQTVLRMGSREQAPLRRRGDDVRIDWGYLYLAIDGRPGASSSIAPHAQSRTRFEASSLPDSDDLPDGTAPGAGSTEALAVSLDLGSVGAAPVSRYLILAYDDLYSIEYFQRAERPWWRRHGADAAELLRDARRDHDSLLERSRAFDDELMADMRAAGGEQYARLGALAYRQTLAAHQLAADADGTAMYFPKENFSNGCISTVDVIYPSAPFTLLFNPLL